MNNEYTNPSTMSNNTWSSAGQSTNPSQTNSNNNNQSQPTSTATSTFNNYTLNTKWGSHNSSQSSTPTNPSTLTTTFPSCMYPLSLSLPLHLQNSKQWYLLCAILRYNPFLLWIYHQNN